MNLVRLDKIFDLKYGNNFSLQDMSINGKISFVSRGSKNNGIVEYVQQTHIRPFEVGLLTVALSGSSVLETFLQEKPFYTSYHIKVLIPKVKLSRKQKLIYCTIIRANKYRYNYGRQANKTLEKIMIPTPSTINQLTNIDIPVGPINDSHHSKKISLNDREWKYFMLKELFDMQRGAEIIYNCKSGSIKLISSSDSNNGLNTYISEGKKLFNCNSITVANDGSIGSCFYQKENFYAIPSITVLTSPYINQYNALFITTLISNEKYKFNYGRKWGFNRMKNSKIKLPINNHNKPDWDFMEYYIKSLPYSSNLDIKNTIR